LMGCGVKFWALASKEPLTRPVFWSLFFSWFDACASILLRVPRNNTKRVQEKRLFFPLPDLGHFFFVSFVCSVLRAWMATQASVYLLHPIPGEARSQRSRRPNAHVLLLDFWRGPFLFEFPVMTPVPAADHDGATVPAAAPWLLFPLNLACSDFAPGERPSSAVASMRRTVF